MKYSLGHGVSSKIKKLPTKFINLGIASLFAITSLSGAAPLFLVGTAHAASPTRYVSVSGSDALNDCSDHANPCATLQYAIDQATAGDTIQLNSNITTTSEVQVKKALTIDGSGKTLSGTITKSGSDNSYLEIQSTADVTVNDLTVDGASGNVHGINIYQSTNVTLNHVTVLNNGTPFYFGGPFNYGLVVNASVVTVNSITTSGNSGGIDVDKGSVSHPAILTVTGTSRHADFLLNGIYIDHPSSLNRVIQTQYSSTPFFFGGELYTINLVAPVLTVTAPDEGSTVSTKVNGNKLVIKGTFTDDVKANYATMQLVHNGSSVAIGTLYGYGSVYNPTATYAAADGSYTFNLPVPSNLASGDYSLFYTGTDFEGGVTARMERKFTIDNDKPTANLTSPTTNSFNPSELVVEVQDETALNKVTANIYNEANTTLLKSCSASASSATSYTLTCPVPDLSDGVYTIRANASDKAGNVSSTITRQFTVDHTPPTASITMPSANAVVNGSSITIKGSANDTAAFNYFYCYVTLPGSSEVGTRGADCNTTWHSVTDGVLGTVDLTGLSDGNYEAHLVAYDKAGNHSDINYAVPFTLDNTAPTATINTYSGTDTTPTLTGTVDDPTADLTVAIDGGTPATATNNGDGTWSYTLPTALSVGSHTVALVASDTVGNSYQTTANITVEAAHANTAGLTASNSRGNSNQAPGHQPTVTVIPNNDGQVLGASTENTGEVKGDSTSLPTVNLANDSATKKAANAKASNFLGLGWWWLLVVGVALGIFWLTFGRSSKTQN